MGSISGETLRCAVRAGEIMRRDVEWVREDCPAIAAARVMRDKNVGILPVCDAVGRVVGVITDRDIAVRVCAEDRCATTSVHDVMTRDVVSCTPGQSVAFAEKLMSRHHITRLVVIDHRRLAGLLSLSDVTQYEPAARVGQTLGAIAERKYRPESP